MVRNLAADARHPVGITAGVSHDAGTPAQTYGNVFSRRGHQTVMAGETALGGFEVRTVAFGLGQIG